MQDLSIHFLNLEILSLNYDHSISSILPDGRIYLSLGKNQISCNLVTHFPVLITDTQDIFTKYDFSEKLLQQTNEILDHKVRELELRNREMSILNDLNYCFQLCETKISIYQSFNKLVPFLLPGTKGGLFQLNLLTDCVESLTSWGVFLDSEISHMAQDFWALHQTYLHRM